MFYRNAAFLTNSRHSANGNALPTEWFCYSGGSEAHEIMEQMCNLTLSSYCGIGNSGTVVVSNCTFSDNIYCGIGNDGTVIVSNSTFSGNGSAYHSGISNGNSGTVTLKNTVVANSQPGINCFGPITDGGGNLSYPDASCPGINEDPKLGPLQNNGGRTYTMALGPGSAAIDAGNEAICAVAPVNNLDQRGVTRPRGPHCDIGAVEQR
jgi:hypothetical protein